MWPDLERLVSPLVNELIADGVEAVAVGGSRVRGAATRYSDLDVFAVGTRDLDGICRVVDGVLVVVACLPREVYRADFRDPAYLTWVPAWRQAEIVYDPDGIAAELRAEADTWTWDVVGGERCDRWVAEQVTSYAEEVHKLASGVELGDSMLSAVQRTVLPLRMPAVMAVHRRVLYESENELWECICAELGSDWRRAFTHAVGAAGSDPAEANAAALKLYRLAAKEATNVFDDRQRVVVELALTLAAEVRTLLLAQPEADADELRPPPRGQYP